jgi:hypothetical protein
MQTLSSTSFHRSKESKTGDLMLEIWTEVVLVVGEGGTGAKGTRGLFC